MLMCMYVVSFSIANAFICMWLLHILSTTEQSNIPDNNKFACFSCVLNT